MKRPEGFDPAGRRQPVHPGRKPTQPGRESRSAATRAQSRPKSPPRPEHQYDVTPRSTTPNLDRVVRTRSPGPDAAARAALKGQARDRRRFERAEVRRFTRRTRDRRALLAIVAGVVATLVALVFLAVYSPLLALRTISVDGTSRVNATDVQAAAADQLGTPLALIDFTRITRNLQAYPLIRSYVTEMVPPGTLLIHVTERTPVGSLLAAGTYNLVDPAGVTIQQSPQRISGVPLIDIGTADVSSPAFTSVVQVLLVLPPSLLSQVDTVSAQTQDDVSLVLTGVGQRVRWGSADESSKKAALLTALIAATDPSSPGEFDVSAPSNGIFRPN
jgi:cell division protein FtsQ